MLQEDSHFLATWTWSTVPQAHESTSHNEPAVDSECQCQMPGNTQSHTEHSNREMITEESASVIELKEGASLLKRNVDTLKIDAAFIGQATVSNMQISECQLSYGHQSPSKIKT